jgi:hypothetical protein
MPVRLLFATEVLKGGGVGRSGDRGIGSSGDRETHESEHDPGPIRRDWVWFGGRKLHK